MLVAAALLVSPELSLGRGGGGGGGHGFGGGFHGGFAAHGLSGARGFGGRGFLVGEIMAASVIAVSVGAVAAFVIVVFATLMGASSALDILTSTRFIIPIITRILSTGLIWDTKCVRASRLHAESGRMKMGVGFC
jgi:hypothetical protein